MNLKISTHQLRIRISQDEARHLLDTGELFETLRWGPIHRIQCLLKTGPLLFETNGDGIQMSIPKDQLMKALLEEHQRDSVVRLNLEAEFNVEFDIDIFRGADRDERSSSGSL